MEEDFSIEVFVGDNALEYIDYISKLRIDTFKEYPYLYEGEINYEKKYIKGYAQDKKSTIIIAKFRDEIAGISTGIPLISDSEIVADVKRVFEESKINSNEYYYYGEVIILPKFRGIGLTRKMFEKQDTIVKKWGFNHICILTVIRNENHPLKPKGYIISEKEIVWKKTGFSKLKLTVNYHWPTLQADGSVKDCFNLLQFWSKPLTDNQNCWKNTDADKVAEDYLEKKL